MDVIRVIVNPHAGNGRARAAWPSIELAMRKAGMAFDTVFTTRPLEATVLARQALLGGAQTIVAVGGDGTVNEVVNGFFDDGVAIAPDARLGVICCGTGSDFIRSLGLPRGQAAVAFIAEAATQTIDLGQVSYRGTEGRRHERLFANVGDLGLGGETALRVNQSSKVLGGFVSFLKGAILSILAHQPKRVCIQLDAQSPSERDVSIVVAANGRYFAGGMLIAPGASLADGLFDVLILEAVSKPDLIFNLLPRVYFGKHVSHPRVRSSRAAAVRVWSAEELLVEVDGEQPGCAEVEFRVNPSAIRVIVGDRRPP